MNSKIDDPARQEARKAGLHAALIYSQGMASNWGPAAIIRWADAFAHWIETGNFQQPNRSDDGRG